MKRRLAIAVLVLISLFAGYRFWQVERTITMMSRIDLGAVAGPADARNVVVEFMDYRCHACRKMGPDVTEFIKRHPDVRVVFRHYPVYGAPSVKEADMALAAAKQGKFMPMHEYLLSREEPVDDAEIQGIAERLGLDADRLRKDMKAADIGQQLLDTIDAGDTLGIDKVPSFLFNGTVYTATGEVPDISGLELLYNQYKRH